MSSIPSNTNISATARISPSATIGEHVVIEDYVIVGDDVVIGDHCYLHSHSVIRANTILKEHVIAESFCVIGGNPGIVGFDRSIKSGVLIGAHTVIAEGVTVHRASRSGAMTTVGEHCMLMPQSHVAHDCVVKDHVTIVNQALLGGHVQVDHHAMIGGAAVLHQFMRVGAYAMVGGAASLTVDVPPATMVTQRDVLSGLNSVGLRRAGFSPSARTQLKRLYRMVLQGAGNPCQLAANCLERQSDLTELSQLFLDFFTPNSRRGYVRDKKTLKQPA